MIETLCDCTPITCQVMQKRESIEPTYWYVLDRITSPTPPGRLELSPYAGLLMLHAHLENITLNGHKCKTTVQVKYLKNVLDNSVNLLQSDIPNQLRTEIIESAYASIDRIFKGEIPYSKLD